MKTNLIDRFLSRSYSKPGPEFVAQQLRKPTGDFAEKIAAKMNQVNAPLYDLTLEIMELNDHESILEIGFASGKFFEKMYRQAEGLQVSGIDYSPEMVTSATILNQSLIDSKQLLLKQGNSNNIPFPDHSFDKVFCNMVIYFWEEPAEHLKEVYRVLKPEGKFFTGLRSKESMHKLPFTKHGFTVYGEKEWTSILQENRFKITGIEKKNDPETDLDNQNITMESIVIVAEKASA